jgi:hypothetical protein
MLKLEQGKKTSNAARLHKGLHVSLKQKLGFVFYESYLGYVGIFNYLF